LNIPDGTIGFIVSDDTMENKCFRNHLQYYFCGEDYDARLEKRDGIMNSFDDKRLATTVSCKTSFG